MVALPVVLTVLGSPVLTGLTKLNEAALTPRLLKS